MIGGGGGYSIKNNWVWEGVENIQKIESELTRLVSFLLRMQEQHVACAASEHSGLQKFDGEVDKKNSPHPRQKLLNLVEKATQQLREHNR